MSRSQQFVLSRTEVCWQCTHACRVDLPGSWAQMFSLPGSWPWTQSPSLLAPGHRRPQGHRPAPVTGIDHFNSMHGCTCADTQSWPRIVLVLQQAHTCSRVSYLETHRPYGLSSIWLGFSWSPIALSTVVSPLETPVAHRPFHLLAG